MRSRILSCKEIIKEKVMKQSSSVLLAANGNAMDMLSFRVGGQNLGINIFKTKEVIALDSFAKITKIPGSHDYIMGSVKVRDTILPILDTPFILTGKRSTNREGCYLIVAEANEKSYGLMVNSVDDILHIRWSEISPPSVLLGKNNLLSAVAKSDKGMIGLLDIEKIFSRIDPKEKSINEQDLLKVGNDKRILIVDDSLVAYKQIERLATSMGFSVDRCKDGQEAYDSLLEITDRGMAINDYYDLLIVDVEMPRMDGYTLVRKIRSTNKMMNSKVLMNSSISSLVSHRIGLDSGADSYLAKFNPKEIRLALINSVNNKASSDLLAA